MEFLILIVSLLFIASLFMKESRNLYNDSLIGSWKKMTTWFESLQRYPIYIRLIFIPIAFIVMIYCPLIVVEMYANEFIPKNLFTALLQSILPILGLIIYPTFLYKIFRPKK